MATDYTANAKKNKEKQTEEGEAKPEKNLEVVVKGEVKLVKKSLGRRIKDLIVEADLKGAAVYVVMNRMIPYARDLAVLSGEDWLRRVIYRGKDHLPRSSMHGMPGAGYRVQYNSPLNRSGGYPPDPRTAPPVQQGPRRPQQISQDDLVLSSYEDAKAVLEEMKNIIEQFDVVSVFDLHEIIGTPTSPTDMKWGWFNLTGTPIHQVRDGFLLALPPVEQI